MSERNGNGHEEERLAQRAKALFDESVDALDGETLSRLNKSRQRALAEARRGSAQAHWSRWAPLGAAAAAAIAVALWWTLRGADALPGAAPSDVEILLAEDDLELLEDLEFYRWMALEATGEEPGADDDVG